MLHWLLLFFDLLELQPHQILAELVAVGAQEHELPLLSVPRSATPHAGLHVSRWGSLASLLQSFGLAI